MGGQRQPIELVIAKGKKHLTKAEIESGRNSEVQPITDDIIAPAYLTAKQKTEFYKIANQLLKLKIMGETDVDALSRYIIAQNFYTDSIKDLRKLPKEKPKRDDFDDINDYYFNLDLWYKREESLIKRQEKYFKQARSSANDLGLSISSRCKLVVPQTQPEAPKENKFKKFEKSGQNG
jgi:P27 family predicted phage terminase small subunit